MSKSWRKPIYVLRGMLVAICLLLTASMSLHGHANLSDFLEGMALGLAVGMAGLTFSMKPAEWNTVEPPSGIEPLKLN